MRGSTAGFLANLANETTTLCTCWRIIRRDGIEYFFTDHDKDVRIGRDIYRSQGGGYSRSAISMSSDLKVDTMTFTGFFDPASWEASDVRAGLFDLAYCEMYLVDYKRPPEFRAVILRVGNLGEVQIHPSGNFEVEMRGLKQRFLQVIGEKYQPECRADFGGPECTFPVNPPVLLPGQDVKAGEWYRSPNVAGASITNLTLDAMNLGFNDDSHWTRFGVATPLFGDPSMNADFPDFGTPPREGAAAFGGSLRARQAIYQEVDVSAHAAIVDAGEAYLSGGIYMAGTADTNDSGRYYVQCLNEKGVSRQLIGLYRWRTPKPDRTWIPYSFADEQIVSGTRTLRIWVQAGAIVQFDADDADAIFFDAAQLTLHRAMGNPAARYGNVIYESQADGTTSVMTPEYAVSGSAFPDGSASMKPFPSWTKHATVIAINDNEYTLAVDDAGLDFSIGSVTWLTGRNRTLTHLIREWDRTVSTITLHDVPAYPVEMSDELIVAPGCDKRLITCARTYRIPDSINLSNGNSVWFRGEPYLPGRDQVLRVARLN